MKTQNATRKGRILQVTIETMADCYPDISHIGEYTDDYSSAAIVAETGEFVADIERRTAILDRLTDRIWELRDNDRDTTIAEKRHARLSAAWEDCNYIPERGKRYCRFFLAYAGGEKPGAAEFRKYALQDYNLMESYNRGDWCYIGMRAVADITLPGSSIIQRISSGGLWGIESDSGSDYIGEVEKDELAALRQALENVGFSPRQIAAAYRDIQRRDR
jgi:hypothetical protein